MFREPCTRRDVQDSDALSCHRKQLAMNAHTKNVRRTRPEEHTMPNFTRRYAYAALTPQLLALQIALVFALASAASAAAQNNDAQSPPADYEVQLYVLVASQSTSSYSPLPPALRSMTTQLRNSLSFENYGVAITSLIRVPSGGSASANSVTTALPAPTEANGRAATYYGYELKLVRPTPDAAGQNVVQFAGFNFTMRVPIKTLGGGLNYESVGQRTSLTLRENTPTLVGTLTTSRPDELLILVAQVRRASGR